MTQRAGRSLVVDRQTERQKGRTGQKRAISEAAGQQAETTQGKSRVRIIYVAAGEESVTA
jgi:hypothetical protein